MPIYEYECETHGIVQQWVKFGEEPSRCQLLTDMGNGPVCGEPLKKILSKSNFRVGYSH